jgi:N-acylneuraminate cytidylyltransferase
MSLNEPYVVALIPARSGSKGVPNKNIKTLGGIPLIAWTIRASLKSKRISRTIVSTDLDEYAKISREFGADVPFIRPSSISTDKSGDIEFVLHALEFFKSEARKPDFIIHLRPTTPFRDPQVIDSAVDLFLSKPELTSLRSVHEMSESAYKTFEISDHGILKSTFIGDINVDGSNVSRQSFPTTYAANGYVDVLKTSYIESSQQLHGNNAFGYETDFVQEVDSEEDFDFLEFQVRNYPRISDLIGIVHNG